MQQNNNDFSDTEMTSDVEIVFYDDAQLRQDPTRGSSLAALASLVVAPSTVPPPPGEVIHQDSLPDIAVVRRHRRGPAALDAPSAGSSLNEAASGAPRVPYVLAYATPPPARGSQQLPQAEPAPQDSQPRDSDNEGGLARHSDAITSATTRTSATTARPSGEEPPLPPPHPDHSTNDATAAALTPSLVRAYGRMASCDPSVFHTAALPTYEEYLSATATAPVYGIPVMYAPVHSSVQEPPPLLQVATTQPPPPPGFSSDRRDFLIKARRLTIMCCISDIVIIGLLMTVVLWLGVLVIFPLGGCLGAYLIRLRLLSFYLAYFPLALAARGYAGYVTIAYSDRSDDNQVALVIMCVLGGLAEIYVAFTVLRCRRYMADADSDLIASIRPDC
jgi:hypothetical protein